MRVFVCTLAVLAITGCSHLTNLGQATDSSPSPALGQTTSANAATPFSSLVEDPNCTVTAGELAAYEGPEYLDLWQRLRAGFALEYKDHPRIETHRDWYARNKSYMRRVTERGRRYLYGIVEKLDERDMPHELALLPIVESAFDPFAYSHGRASGMWQFIPATGKRFGLGRNYWYDGRRDIEASTEAALDYLSYLHGYFDGDWLLALASYNTGEGNVRRAIRRNQRAGKPTDFWSLRLPRETRAYVPQLLALSQIVMDPQAYDIALTPIDNEPFYRVVDVNSQIDLAKAAELAELDMEDLYHLNPAFNQWATDPSGPHQLLIPVDKVETFKANLQDYPPEKRVGWHNYRVKKGDSLLAIAKRYNTTPRAIKQINNLSGNIIRVDQRLLIPRATADSNHYTHSKTQRTRRTQNNAQGRDGTRKVTYRVEAGDSLWEIARSYQVGVRQLAEWNAMAPRDPLRVGQKLVLWTPLEARAQQVSLKRQDSPLIRKIAYRVRRGDSLSRIASKFNLSVSDIANWNSLKKNNYIHPGQRLTLWVDLTRAQ